MTCDSASLRRGAKTLIGECLAATPNDGVLVVGNAATRTLTEHVVAAARDLCPATYTEVEPVTEENYPDVLNAIVAALETTQATVSVFAGADEHDLLAWNHALTEAVRQRGIRHAHMPGLDEQCLAIGMAGPYRDVERFNAQMAAILEPARDIAITNDDGTDIVLQCDPPRRTWTALTGIYDKPGQFGRLPQGEIFCAPLQADGTIAARTIGYPFNGRWGLLDQPVVIEVADGNAVSLRHETHELETTLWTWLAGHENGLCLGELALGTNRHLPALTGNLLFDENVPGVHIAFGHPFPEYTGATYRSPIHVDLVIKEPDVTIDGIELMLGGQYRSSLNSSQTVST